MANHLAFPNPLLPVTRREAREPYASDDKAEADDRDRIYSRNQPKAFAASKRLQHSLGVYNDEIWPNPEPCCLIGSQIVEINRNKLLAALSECGEVGPCLDQSTGKCPFGPFRELREVNPVWQALRVAIVMPTQNFRHWGIYAGKAKLTPTSIIVCIQKENPHDKDARASSVANKTGLRKTTAIGPPQEATSDPEFSPVNGPLTESLCQASDLRVTPVSNLTFENIDTAMTAPERSRQILIRHLEIGVEGVEAIVQGQAYFGHEINQSRSAPSSDDASLQQIAARNATRSLIDSCACQSVTWTFFGILFGQWVEEGNQIPSHWICLGVPEKATDTRIFAQRVDGATDGQLGGGKWLMA